MVYMTVFRPRRSDPREEFRRAGRLAPKRHNVQIDVFFVISASHLRQT
jgi:hypothetical protein